MQNKTPIIVTGLSGAGMTSALKTLEDLQFEVFDNFPLSLVDALLQETGPKNIAIGIDTRSRGFDAEKLLAFLKRHNGRLIFMTCDDSVLQRRFTETRRRHPLADSSGVRSGILKERSLLSIIQDQADITIDTTELSIHDLRHILKRRFNLEDRNTLTVSLISFGFRYGLPREADIVQDVRFLKNPHWDTALRPKTGLDEDVGEYIQTDKAFAAFLEKFKDLLDIILPRYTAEGKSYLTIAIGCTGGQHRSVFTAKCLKNWIEKQGFEAHVEHRDLKK